MFQSIVNSESNRKSSGGEFVSNSGRSRRTESINLVVSRCDRLPQILQQITGHWSVVTDWNIGGIASFLLSETSTAF